MEPNVSDDIYAALYAPTGGIVCPFHLNIALAEKENIIPIFEEKKAV